MNVVCPRGANCPGSTQFQRHECFLSETRNRPPARFTRDFNFIERLAIEYANIEFQIYQCAACGSEVYFIYYQGKNGPVYKRVGDSLE
jgi:hypothetical protein